MIPSATLGLAAGAPGPGSSTIASIVGAAGVVFANIAATALGVASLILKALTLVVTITDLTATLNKTAKANLLGT